MPSENSSSESTSWINANAPGPTQTLDDLQFELDELGAAASVAAAASNAAPSAAAMGQFVTTAKPRGQLLVENRLQISLIVRSINHSICCILYFSGVMFCTSLYSQPSQPLSYHFNEYINDAVFWLPGLLVMIPLMAYDMLRHSNRFVGPIYRLKCEIRKLLGKVQTRHVKIREDDYYQELIDEYNQLRGEYLDMREQLENSQRMLAAARVNANAATGDTNATATTVRNRPLPGRKVSLKGG
ncbi:MAG: hypothetical protein AAFP69_14045 [Planctomycetota bacterium]